METIYFPAKGDKLTLAEDAEMELNGSFHQNARFFEEFLEIARSELRSLNDSFATAGGFKSSYTFLAGTVLKIRDVELRTNARERDKIVFDILSMPGHPEITSDKPQWIAVNPNIISGVKCSDIQKYDMNAMYYRKLDLEINSIKYHKDFNVEQKRLSSLCESRVNHGQITREQADKLIQKIESFDVTKIEKSKATAAKRRLLTNLSNAVWGWDWKVIKSRPKQTNQYEAGEKLDNWRNDEVVRWKAQVSKHCKEMISHLQALKDSRTPKEYKAIITKYNIAELEYFVLPEELKA